MKTQITKTVSVSTETAHSRVLFLAQAAVIAALYVVLTFLANAFGLANYAVQIRFSEALTILPYFTPAAIPGLFIGCFLSNILTGCALPDILFGSLATLLGALGTYALRRWKWCAPVCPILANTIIVPLILIYGYGLLIEGMSLIQCLGFYCLTVGAGEVISCGILGMILLTALEKYSGRLFAK
ncbi:MAG: QueT transporter family protein [Bacteroidales bacterium]|nr:QueT transporter family protein [Bacteroidales bacterium]MCM1416167.1 QueT transporter family protein [bacterium]MCM1424192.1 QueT transporter family protein [bacterium]